jgi:hypothetical protein
MSDEFLFTVSGSKAQAASRITLAEAGLRERDDLQEWVIAHPQLLGSNVKIVTFEFDRWWSSSGDKQLDRLDVLGLDESGTLVVAELKRDRAPETVEMQAIKYAAMSSRFTLDTLAQQHARFLTARGTTTTEEDAKQLLLEHAPELSADTLRRPRIVLLAGDYPPVVTATAVWLSEMGLDFTLMRFQTYRTEHEIVLTVSQLFPVPDVEDFTVSPRVAEARSVEESKTKAREASTVKRLVDARTLADGTALRLVVRSDVNVQMRDAIEAWIAEDATREWATWRNDVAAPLIWKHDGGKYTPTGLARHIVATATGIDRALRGPRWWMTDQGEDLHELASEPVSEKNQLYERFWERFIQRMRDEHPDWSNMRVPPRQNWISMPSPVKGTIIGMNFGANGVIRTELYIDNGHAEDNKRLFHELETKRDEIERTYGSRLTWEELPHRQASRVADIGDGEVTRLDEWDKYLDWFFDTGARLRQAFGS